jgi:hypothetical protein
MCIIDAKAEDAAEALKKLGGADAILATAPSAISLDKVAESCRFRTHSANLPMKRPLNPIEIGVDVDEPSGTCRVAHSPLTVTPPGRPRPRPIPAPQPSP